MSWVPDEHKTLRKQEVEKYINKKHDVAEIEIFLKRELEKWKEERLNIAVMGSSGAGKSSFINAIRGITCSNSNADRYAVAETGVVKTTKKSDSYPHPKNKNIIFWDLPGKDSPQAYSAVIETCDAFLILSMKRLKDTDENLVDAVKSTNKPFFFIRTHIDDDIRNEENHGRNESDALQIIMQDFRTHLREKMNVEKDVFLISNNHPDKWDFGRLTEAILKDLPPRAMESFFFCVTRLTAGILEGKVEFLKARIWIVAAASAYGTSSPASGVSINDDILKDELEFYKSQLGLTTEQLERVIPDIKEKIAKLFIFTAEEIGEMFTTYVGTPLSEEADAFIPIIKRIVVGTVSFLATYFFLSTRLERMKQIALEVLEEGLIIS